MRPEPTRYRLAPTGWFCLTLLLLATASGAQPSTPQPAAPPPPDAAPAAAQPAASSAKATTAPRSAAMREGTEVVDQLGHFRKSGDRIVFFPAGSADRWTVLENLNLQRIVRAISNSAPSLEWRVTGTITEYRGGNYLYVRSAVLRTANESREITAP